MKDYLKDYFTNPSNIDPKMVQDWNYNEVSPEDFLKIHKDEQRHAYVQFYSIKCADWFSMSVQASHGHACEPKITCYSTDNFIYKEMEVGFPSDNEELLNEYNSGGWIYSYVPVDVINDIIEKHWWIK